MTRRIAYTINMILDDYPDGLVVEVDGNVIYRYTPLPSKQEPVDGTGWAEAAFDPSPDAKPCTTTRIPHSAFAAAANIVKREQAASDWVTAKHGGTVSHEAASIPESVKVWVRGVVAKGFIDRPPWAKASSGGTGREFFT